MNKTIEPIKGWLYCLYNECFSSYGSTVYKLGRTKNLKQRLQHYRTGYIKPSHFIHISSRHFRDSRKAESILFFILRSYRVTKKREFFNIHDETIRYSIDRLSSLTDDMIDRIYRQILCRVCPDNILDNIMDTDDEPKWFSDSIKYTTDLEAFFEKYRFKPKNPKVYKNLKSIEEYTFSLLIDKCTVTDEDIKEDIIN